MDLTLLNEDESLFRASSFQLGAMSFFKATGHTGASCPLIEAENILYCIYNDFMFASYFDKKEREAFGDIDTLSHMFTVGNETFSKSTDSSLRYYAISLNVIKSERGIVADTILMSFAKSTADFIVIMFQHDRECMLSFAKKTKGCLTFYSDWFNKSKFNEVASNANIANLSLQNSTEFFLDFVYMTARTYYTHPLSLDFAHAEWYSLRADIEEIPNWNNFATEFLCAPIYEYGDDYIEPPNREDYSVDTFEGSDFELDLIELEAELEMRSEDLAEEDNDYDEHDREFYDEFYDNLQHIDADEIPDEILSDPVKLLEWINKNEESTPEDEVDDWQQ